MVGILALIVAAVTGRTLSVLIGAGALMAVAPAFRTTRPLTALLPSFSSISVSPTLFAILPAAAMVSVSLLSLFLVFLKVGSVVFGSGYVLLAFLKADLVDHRHWLTNSQLLDAVAVGQVTPGPVFTTATFIGYLLAGLPGAAWATFGIFLPGFLLVAISGPLIPWLRRSPLASHFLDGVNVAALALMAVVTWQLGRASIRDWATAGLAALSAVLLLRFRVNSFWLIAVGAVAGLLLQRS
jgi:chromate transporter